MKSSKYIGIVGIALTAVAVISLFPSCREKPTISDQIVVTAIGLEKKNDTYHLSIQAVDALKTAGSLSEQSENATAVYRTQGISVAQALQAFLNETGRSTYILHNRIIALGLSQCRETPLQEQLDYFIRNLEGRSLVQPIVCRGDPADLLSIHSGNDAIPAEYVAQLLDEGVRCGLAVSSRILDIQRAMSGMYDAALPILTVEDGVPRLDGTALFRDGWLVGELTAEQTKALLLAEDRLEQCLFVRGGLTFRLSQIDTRLQISRRDNGCVYRFLLNTTAQIVESGTPLPEAEKQQLTEELSQYISQTLCDTVRTVIQTYACDPLGLARQTAKQYKEVTQAQARQQFDSSEIEATVEIRLTESGFLT